MNEEEKIIELINRYINIDSLEDADDAKNAFKEYGDYIRHKIIEEVVNKLSNSQNEKIIAICKDGHGFTEWISDSNECPKCESEMLFKHTLSTPQVVEGKEEWRKEQPEMVKEYKQLLNN